MANSMLDDCDMDADFLDVARRQASDFSSNMTRPVNEKPTPRRILVRSKPSLYDPVELDDDYNENESNNIMPGRGLSSYRRSSRPGGKPSFLEDQLEKAEQIREMANGYLYSNDYIEMTMNAPTSRSNFYNAASRRYLTPSSPMKTAKDESQTNIYDMSRIHLKVSPPTSANSTPSPSSTNSTPTKSLRKPTTLYSTQSSKLEDRSSKPVTQKSPLKALPPSCNIPLYEIIKRKSKPSVLNVEAPAYQPPAPNYVPKREPLPYGSTISERDKLDISSLQQFPRLGY